MEFLVRLLRSRLAQGRPAFQRHGFAWWAGFCIALACTTNGSAYVLEGPKWPAGTVVNFQLGLGNASQRLQDGNTSWDTAAMPALGMWNQQLQRVRFAGTINGSAPVTSGDRINVIVFSNSVFGKSFGSSTLAVTYYTYTSTIGEADILFNSAQTFNSYRGALQFGSNGYAIADIRRVLLHELGHALGLDHPDQGGQNVDAVMNSVVSNRETLSTDDINGGVYLYGAATAPAATPTPTPTPSASASHLANISTRLRVGTNDDVLIGGFVIRGSTPKNMILRAMGPSLRAAGVTGAMDDPSLELHNASGAVIASNDDWQSGAQVNEISATGLAPANRYEAALIAALPSGSYTAIVRGYNNATGIGLIEGYELDSTSTRFMNLSTRGRIGLNDDVMIGGVVVEGNTKKLAVRAVGPSLTGLVPGALADPTLELRNAAGTLIASNDNWSTSSQSAEISASGVAPSNPRESAVVMTLAAGNYTAIVRGTANGTGIGMVEVYDLDP